LATRELYLRPKRGLRTDQKSEDRGQKSDLCPPGSPGGEDFLVEPADEFDKEIASLGSSERFMSFLEARSKEAGDLPIADVRKKRGI